MAGISAEEERAQLREFLRSLHGESGPGHVTLFTKPGPDGSENWCRHYQPPMLADAAEAVPDVCNVYISVNQFRWRGGKIARTIPHLASLRALFADLDTYNVNEWQSVPPTTVCRAVLTRLEQRAFPEPSLVVFTGRGLQALWLVDPLPPMALPRWASVQRAMPSLLDGFGLDRGALDVARVIRLPGTINTRSGKRAEIIHVGPPRHSFDEIAARMLPVDREILRERVRARRRNRKQSDGPGSPRGDAVRQFHVQMVRDIERLIEWRWQGQIPEGRRNIVLHIYASFLVRLVGSEELPTALQEFSRRVCSVDERELRSISKSIVTKLEDGRGYRYTAEVAALRLGVDHEMADAAGLERLRPRDPVREAQRHDAKRARDRQRKADQRRANGARARSESAERMQPWQEQGISRATYYRRRKNLWRQRPPRAVTVSETIAARPTVGDPTRPRPAVNEEPVE